MSSMTIGEIAGIMFQRRMADTLLVKRMIEMRDRYNGDLILPFPDVKNNPSMKPPVPNIIAEAVDDQARRACTMPPRITAPSKDPASDSANAAAADRKRALYGRWFDSQLDLKLYRAFRHLIGYGTFSMVVVPDPIDNHAVIELRDPLSAYPELRAQDDVREPLNVGFINSRSISWIKAHFPDTAQTFLANAAGKNWDTLWDMVEWIDENEIVIGIIGPKQPAYGVQEARTYPITAYELARYPNKAGCVPVVCPRRVTMDRIQGQLMGLIETCDLFGRVTALDLMAMERAIFPDLVIISKTGGPPQIYSGDQWHDGRSGKVNTLSDAVVEQLQSSAGPGGAQVIENLERALRSTGGAMGVTDMQAARTGAGVGALQAVSADPRMQESQAIVARALACINEYVMKVELGYAPQQKFFLIPGLRGDMTPVRYTPEKLFDFTQTVVDYPYAGMDMASLTVLTSQLEGTDLSSKRTLRIIHPLIDDGMQEEQLLVQEGVDAAVMAGLQARMEQDPSFLPVGAHVSKLVSQGKSIGDAMTEAMAIVAASQQQSQQQQQAPGPTGQPSGPTDDQGNPLTPDALRMLTATGAAPGTGSTPIPPPDASLTNEQRLNRAISSKISPGAV